MEEQGNLSAKTKSTPTEGLVKEIKPAGTWRKNKYFNTCRAA